MSYKNNGFTVSKPYIGGMATRSVIPNQSIENINTEQEQTNNITRYTCIAGAGKETQIEELEREKKYVAHSKDTGGTVS